MDQGQSHIGHWDPNQYGNWNETQFASATSFNHSHEASSGYNDPDNFEANGVNLNQQAANSQYSDFSFFSVQPSQQVSGWVGQSHAAAVSQPNGVPQGSSYAGFQAPGEMNTAAHSASNQHPYGLFAGSGQASQASESFQQYNQGSAPAPQDFDHECMTMAQCAVSQNQWQSEFQNMKNGYDNNESYGNVLAQKKTSTSLLQAGICPPQQSHVAQQARFMPSADAHIVQGQGAADRQSLRGPLSSSNGLQQSVVGTASPVPSTQAQLSMPSNQNLARQVPVCRTATTSPSVTTFAPSGKASASHLATRPAENSPRPFQLNSGDGTPSASISLQPASTKSATGLAGVKTDSGEGGTGLEQMAGPEQNCQFIVAIPAKLESDGGPQAMADEPDADLMVDRELFDKACEQADSNQGWPNVWNIVVDDDLQTCNIPERMTRQPMAMMGTKPPLFDCSTSRCPPWTQAEILGMHLNHYLRIPRDPKFDVERIKADSILDVFMHRAGRTVPKNWWTDVIPSEGRKRRLPEWKTGSEASERLNAPKDAVTRLRIRAHAVLATPCLNAQTLPKDHDFVTMMAEDYAELVDEMVKELKECPVFLSLTKAFVERKRKGSSAELEERIAELQGDFKRMQDEFAAVIEQGLQDAHAAVIEALADVKGIAVALFNTLNRLLNVKVGFSRLVHVILQLLARFTAVKPSQLENYKFTSYEGRMCAKSQLDALENEEVSALVATILDNAKKNEGNDVVIKVAKPSHASAKVADAASGRRTMKAAGKSAMAYLGNKRPREDDGEVPKWKKATTESATLSPSPLLPTASKAPPAASKAGQCILGTKPSAPKSFTTPASKIRPGMMLPGKTRPMAAKAVAKTDSPKSSDTEKPVGPETAVKAKVSKTEAKALTTPAPIAVSTSSEVARPSKPKPELRVPEPPQSSSSSLAALLAEIDEPKAAAKKASPTPKGSATPDGQESEQDRARRLRKEKRRALGLRVTFKSDDGLVEVREFHSEEGERRAMRDVKSDGKDRREGMVLKQSHAGEILPWEEPTAVDFGHVAAEKRAETLWTRGGIREFTTEQQKAMEERERTRLMVIYTDPSYADIPPTPKSPAPEASTHMDATAPVVELPVDDPRLSELHQRRQDQALWGFWRAMHEAQLRLEDRTRIPDPAHLSDAVARRFHIGPDPDPTKTAHRDQQTIQLLLSSQARDFRDPDLDHLVGEPDAPTRSKPKLNYPNPTLQQAMDLVENTFETVKQQNREARRRLEEHRQQVNDASPALAQINHAQQVQDYSAAWAAYYAQQAQQNQQTAYAQLIQQAPPQQHQQQVPAVQVLLATIGSASSHTPPDPAAVQALMAAFGGPQPEKHFAEPHWYSSVQQQPVHQQPPQPQHPQSQRHEGFDASFYDDPPADFSPPNEVVRSGRNHGRRDRDRDRDGDTHMRGGYLSYDDAPASNTTIIKNSHHGGKHGKKNKKGGHGHNNNSNNDSKGVNRPVVGSKACSFYAKGVCAKGDNCTFRHE